MYIQTKDLSITFKLMLTISVTYKLYHICVTKTNKKFFEQTAIKSSLFIYSNKDISALEFEYEVVEIRNDKYGTMT